MIPGPSSRLAPSFLPPVGVLEITYRCNHACLFCSCPWEDPRPSEGGGVRLQRRPELGFDEWKACIARLCEMGVADLAFTGGEPLLKEGVADLVRFAASQQVEHVEDHGEGLVSTYGPPRIHFLTNGRILDDPFLDLLAEVGAQVSVSLPGLSSYSTLTGGGDPARALQGLQAAHERGLSTTVAVTVTRLNLSELYETIAAGFVAGADSLLMNRFLPGGRGLAHADRLSLSPEQVVEMLDVAEQVLRRANRKGHVGTELPKCILGNRDYTQLRVGSRCSAATGFFVVGPSGWIRACNHSPVEMHFFTEIDRVRDHPWWRRLIRKDFLPDACRGCGRVGSCDAGCREAAHIVGGSLSAPDPCMTGPLLDRRSA